MRDDTLYTTISAPDRKARLERLAVLEDQRARAKPLERAQIGWKERLGICVGCMGMLVLLVFALAVWFGFAK